jgi:hypothetical protein
MRESARLSARFGQAIAASRQGIWMPLSRNGADRGQHSYRLFSNIRQLRYGVGRVEIQLTGHAIPECGQRGITLVIEQRDSKKRLPTWVLILGGVLSLALIGPTVRYIVSNGVQAATSASESPTTAEVRSAFEMQFSNDPMFKALRVNFPSDYEQMVEQLSQSVSSQTMTQAEIGRSGFLMSRNFMSSKFDSISQAPPAQLKSVVDSQYKMASYLADHDVTLCARMAVNGLDSASGLSEEFLKLGSYFGQTLVEAARAGQDYPTKYTDISMADIEFLREKMSLRPTGKRSADLFFTNTISEASEQEQCAVSVDLFQALSSMSPYKASMWMSPMFQERAKAQYSR